MPMRLFVWGVRVLRHSKVAQIVAMDSQSAYARRELLDAGEQYEAHVLPRNQQRRKLLFHVLCER